MSIGTFPDVPRKILYMQNPGTRTGVSIASKSAALRGQDNLCNFYFLIFAANFMRPLYAVRIQYKLSPTKAIQLICKRLDQEIFSTF